MNIVEMILKLLNGGDIIGKIASMLGIGQEQAGKAVSAAVPTVLAGLAGAARRPGGKAHLARAVANQDPRVVDNLSGFFSGGGSAAASQGSTLLGSLLGTGGFGRIRGVLSRFTGVGESGTGKLLGLLGPVVLSAIGKQSIGMDPAGVARMVVGQKANIASALPSGLGGILSSAVPALSSILGSVSDATSSAPRTATDSGHPVPGLQAKRLSPLRGSFSVALLTFGLFFLPRMCGRVSDNIQVVKDHDEMITLLDIQSATLSASNTFAVDRRRIDYADDFRHSQ